MGAQDRPKCIEGITLDDLLFLVLEEKRTIDRIVVELAKIRAKDASSEDWLPTEAVFDILEALDEAHMDTRDAVVALALNTPPRSSPGSPVDSEGSSSSSSNGSTITPLASLDEPLDSSFLQPPIPPSPISSLPGTRSRSLLGDEEGADTTSTPMTSPCSHREAKLAPSTPTPTPTDRSGRKSVRISPVGPPPTPPPNRPLPPIPSTSIDIENDVPTSPTSPNSSARASGASWPFLRHRASHFSDPSSEDVPIRPPSPRAVRFASIRSSRVTIEDGNQGMRSFLESDDESDDEDDDGGSPDDEPAWGKTKAEEMVRKVKDCLKVCRAKMRSSRVVAPAVAGNDNEDDREVEAEYTSNAPLSLLPIPASSAHLLFPHRH